MSMARLLRVLHEQLEGVRGTRRLGNTERPEEDEEDNAVIYYITNDTTT